MKQRIFWFVLSLLIMSALWRLSAQSELPGPKLTHPRDWIAHTAAYCVLSFSLVKATKRWEIALVSVAWFGALDEVHQAFVPFREAGLADWLFDVAGAWLGTILAGRNTRNSP